MCNRLRSLPSEMDPFFGSDDMFLSNLYPDHESSLARSRLNACKCLCQLPLAVGLDSAGANREFKRHLQLGQVPHIFDLLATTGCAPPADGHIVIAIRVSSACANIIWGVTSQLCCDGYREERYPRANFMLSFWRHFPFDMPQDDSHNSNSWFALKFMWCGFIS